MNLKSLLCSFIIINLCTQSNSPATCTNPYIVYPFAGLGITSMLIGVITYLKYMLKREQEKDLMPPIRTQDLVLKKQYIQARKHYSDYVDKKYFFPIMGSLVLFAAGLWGTLSLVAC